MAVDIGFASTLILSAITEHGPIHMNGGASRHEIVQS